MEVLDKNGLNTFWNKILEWVFLREDYNINPSLLQVDSIDNYVSLAANISRGSSNGRPVAIDNTNKVNVVNFARDTSVSTYDMQYNEQHVIFHNTDSSDHVVALPTGDKIVNLSGDNITVKAGGYSELNIINNNGEQYFTRFA